MDHQPEADKSVNPGRRAKNRKEKATEKTTARKVSPT